MGVDTNLIFKIAGLAIIISILFSFLKQANRDEYANLVVLAGLSIVMLWVIPLILNLFTTVRSVFQFY
ncbi:MAG: stage III sporulation protein AC [Bacillota bacterium]